MILNEEEIAASCEAVRQFLIDGEKFINGGNIPCLFIEGSQKNETTINIQFAHHIPSYNLDDDVFKSYGLRNPIWSAYKLLKWDSIDKELIIEVNQYQEIRLKRIKTNQPA
jgi:hypothetical protein